MIDVAELVFLALVALLLYFLQRAHAKRQAVQYPVSTPHSAVETYNACAETQDWVGVHTAWQHLSQRQEFPPVRLAPIVTAYRRLKYSDAHAEQEFGAFLRKHFHPAAASVDDGEHLTSKHIQLAISDLAVLGDAAGLRLVKKAVTAYCVPSAAEAGAGAAASALISPGTPGRCGGAGEGAAATTSTAAAPTNSKTSSSTTGVLVNVAKALAPTTGINPHPLLDLPQFYEALLRAQFSTRDFSSMRQTVVDGEAERVRRWSAKSLLLLLKAALLDGMNRDQHQLLRK